MSKKNGSDQNVLNHSRNSTKSQSSKKSSTGTLLFLDYDGSTPEKSTKTNSSQVSEVSIISSVGLSELNSSNRALNVNGKLGCEMESEFMKEKFDSLAKRLHNIESLLWDNRDKYTSSLDIVANREIEISRALDETKKLLRENRELYTQAFGRLFAKEELLENMLKETKEILTENRRIYMEGMIELQKKNNESLEKIKEFGETGILLSKSRPLKLQTIRTETTSCDSTVSHNHLSGTSFIL